MVLELRLLKARIVRRITLRGSMWKMRLTMCWVKYSLRRIEREIIRRQTKKTLKALSKLN